MLRFKYKVVTGKSHTTFISKELFSQVWLTNSSTIPTQKQRPVICPEI